MLINQSINFQFYLLKLNQKFVFIYLLHRKQFQQYKKKSANTYLPDNTNNKIMIFILVKSRQSITIESSITRIQQYHQQQQQKTLKHFSNRKLNKNCKINYFPL